MADREKILKGLEWVINDIEENGNINHAGQYLTEIKDALELLKEQQKPKAAHWVKMKGMMPEYCGHFECDNCGWHGKPLMREIDFAYCPGCGAKMSIDGLHAEDCEKTPFDRMIDDYLEATGGVVDV